ncbi:MAG: DegV family protein [Acidimicrobiales bacterium]
MPATGLVHVVTDNASDLPGPVADSAGVGVVPLSVRFAGTEVGSLEPEDFWARCRLSPVLPETAAPSPGDFGQAFDSAAAMGCSGVVCITLSSELSGTFASARAAASATRDLPIAVIDSRTCSLGEGILVLRAVTMAEKGAGLDEIVTEIEECKSRIEVVATLDTLDNLKKGGRIGGARAFVGSLLSIKPIVAIADGVVKAESKQRTRSRALRHLVDRVSSAISATGIEELGVMHAQAEDIEDFLAMLNDVWPAERVLVGDLGPVIGAHSGPGVIAVAFLRQRK